MAADAERTEQYLKQKEEMNQSHKAFFQRRDELQEHKSRMDKECFRLESQLEKLEESRESQIAYLWEEYETTPDQAPLFQREDLGDRTAIRRGISGLKEEIRIWEM